MMKRRREEEEQWLDKHYKRYRFDTTMGTEPLLAMIQQFYPVRWSQLATLYNLYDMRHRDLLKAMTQTLRVQHRKSPADFPYKIQEVEILDSTQEIIEANLPIVAREFGFICEIYRVHKEDTNFFLGRCMHHDPDARLGEKRVIDPDSKEPWELVVLEIVKHCFS